MYSVTDIVQIYSKHLGIILLWGFLFIQRNHDTLMNSDVVPIRIVVTSQMT